MEAETVAVEQPSIASEPDFPFVVELRRRFEEIEARLNSLSEDARWLASLIAGLEIGSPFDIVGDAQAALRPVRERLAEMYRKVH
jgi:hypothetical protein